MVLQQFLYDRREKKKIEYRTFSSNVQSISFVSRWRELRYLWATLHFTQAHHTVERRSQEIAQCFAHTKTLLITANLLLAFSISTIIFPCCRWHSSLAATLCDRISDGNPCIHLKVKTVHSIGAEQSRAEQEFYYTDIVHNKWTHDPVPDQLSSLFLLRCTGILVLSQFLWFLFLFGGSRLFARSIIHNFSFRLLQSTKFIYSIYSAVPTK